MDHLNGVVIGTSNKDVQIGHKFDRLTVVSFSKNIHGQTVALCSCSCGSGKIIKVVPTRLLKDKSENHSQGCGCFRFVRYSHTKDKALWQYFRGYKGSAHEKGHSFELSYEQFSLITSKPCTYCNCSPNRKLVHKWADGDLNESIRNGIDRIDNSKGHTLENSVSCCSKCNHAKSDGTLGEFVEWALRFAGGKLPEPTTHNVDCSRASPIFSIYRRVARDKKLNMDLTIEQLSKLISSDCAYCGSKPYRIWKCRGTDQKFWFSCNGIDRVNSMLGYTKDNVVPCCPACNYAKHTHCVHKNLGPGPQNLGTT